MFNTDKRLAELEKRVVDLETVVNLLLGIENLEVRDRPAVPARIELVKVAKR